MKKLVWLFLWGSLCALPTHSPNRAAYFHDDARAFNPCDPCFLWEEALSWRVGYYGDFVFNRYLERRQNTHGAGDVQRFAYTTNGGTLTVNAADWFEFFAMLGASNFSMRTPSRVNRAQSEYLFSPRLSWSVGVNAVAWKCGALACGFRGQYFRTMPKIDAFLDYDGGQITYFNDIEKATYYEWQASCGCAYTFTNDAHVEWIPHLAFSASGAKAGMRGLTFMSNGVMQNALNLKEKRMWGYACGLSIILSRIVGVTAEARFADQKAFHLAGEVAF